MCAHSHVSVQHEWQLALQSRMQHDWPSTLQPRLPCAQLLCMLGGQLSAAQCIDALRRRGNKSRNVHGGSLSDKPEGPSIL